MNRWANAVPSSAEQSDTKRKAIIREAARVFNRRGSHGTTLEDVAERLGVSKAALYRYVENKNELLCACHEEAMEIANDNLDIGERVGRTGFENPDRDDRLSANDDQRSRRAGSAARRERA